MDARYLKDSYNNSFSKIKHLSVIQITGLNAVDPALESGT